MDYSAFNSGFGDPEEESPFANPHSASSPVAPHHHTALASPSFADDDHEPNYPSYSPVLGAPQHAVFADPEDGFGTPSGFTEAEVPRTDRPKHEEEQRQASESNGNLPGGPDRAHSQQQQQRQHQHQQPARYKSHPQQLQRPQPQYHLQAKITGLERSGRKDPILKFDVHVCTPTTPEGAPQTDATAIYLDQPSKVPHYTVP